MPLETSKVVRRSQGSHAGDPEEPKGAQCAPKQPKEGTRNYPQSQLGTPRGPGSLFGATRGSQGSPGAPQLWSWFLIIEGVVHLLLDLCHVLNAMFSARPGRARGTQGKARRAQDLFGQVTSSAITSSVNYLFGQLPLRPDLFGHCLFGHYLFGHYLFGQTSLATTSSA